MILNCDVARQRCAVREDVVVADDTVVRNVHPNHEKVARANPRNLSFTTGPEQRHKLSYQIISANHQTAALACKLYILRLAAENRVLKDPVALSRRGVSFDYCMRANLGSS